MRKIADVRSILVVVLAATGAVAGPSGPPLEVTTVTGTLDGAVGGVAVDRLGTIYVADFGNRVFKVSPFGEVAVLADSLYGSSGNAVDSRGNVFQSSFHGDTVSKIGRDGRVTEFASGLAGPVGIAIDGEDRLLVCNCRGNSLSRISPAGDVEPFAASDLFRCPNGITLGEDGTAYVVNFSDGAMLRVSPAGEVESFATIPGGGNGHVTRVGDVFYVTGFRSNRLYRVDAEGRVEAVAGTGRFVATDGAGLEASFASPNGIAYDARRDVLYVNDFTVPFQDRLRVPPTSVVRRIAFPSLTATVRGALAQGGVDAAERAFRDYRRTRPGRFIEVEANALGYALMQEGALPAAVRVFELNAEYHPASSNAHDSLGEAYRAIGDRERAIGHYRTSLELNPANANAVKALEELGAP